MAENNKREVSFTATTKAGSWVTFEKNGQPEGTTVDSTGHILRSVKSVNGIKIKCSPNPNYTKRNDVITFKQDETNDTKETIVTQSGKACDCGAYYVEFNNLYDIIPYYSRQYVIGTISNNAACSLSDVSFLCSIQQAGVEIVNNEIRLEVGENTSEQSRTFTITYKFKNSQCEGTKTITQQGKEIVHCTCDDVNMSCTRKIQSIPFSGTNGNNVTALTYSYSTQCELEGNIHVNVTGDDIRRITATTGTNNTVLVKVGANPSSGQRSRYFSFNLSYTVDNNDCVYSVPFTIEQEGKEVVICNCNSITNVGWIANERISSGGTPNTYVIVSSITVSEGCDVSKISAIITEGSGYATVTTNNGEVRLNVTPNPSSDYERRITVKLRYDGVDCDSIVKTFIQDRKAITCDCDSVTINNTEITLDENSHNTAITTFSVSQGCSIESVSVTADCNYATATTQGNKINLVIGSNTANTRDFYVNVSYDGTPCTSKKIHVTQSGVNCDCSKLTIERLVPDNYEVPRMGIDGYKEILTITSDTCVVDGREGGNINLNFSPSGQGECIYDTTYNQWWLKNVSAYTEIGERTITVTPTFNGNNCSGINFKQDGCHCEEITIESKPVPNDSKQYCLVEYSIPEECANSFSNLRVENVGVYAKGTNYEYDSQHGGYNKSTLYIDTTGKTEDNKRIFNAYVTFTKDSGYNFESNTTTSITGEETELEVRIKLDECDQPISAAFTRSEVNDYGFVMLPLMYRYTKDELERPGFLPSDSYDLIELQGYPYNCVTSGVSVVYAPVGYLETQTSGLSVSEVVSNGNFISFDMPITDYVYDYYTSKTFTNNNHSQLNNKDNIFPIGDIRAVEEINSLVDSGVPLDSAITLANSASEKLIATNQFFFDYGEKTSYDQQIVRIEEPGFVDLQVRDYEYKGYYTGVCTDTNCRLFPQGSDKPYSSSGGSYFYDTLMEESLNSKLHPEDNKNRMIVFGKDTNKSYVYIVYGQGREFVPKDIDTTGVPKELLHDTPHQYLFQYELVKDTSQSPYTVTRQIVKTNNQEVAYAHNLKVTLRPLFKKESDLNYFFCANVLDFGSIANSENEINFYSDKMGDFSYGGLNTHDFRKLNEYICQEASTLFHMYYNFQFSSGLTNAHGSSSGVSINNHSYTANNKIFKQFPLKIFVHNDSGNFVYNHTKYINIASIDEKVTMETMGKSISFRVYKDNIGGKLATVANISYATTTWDDDTEYTLSSETSISEGVQEFTISNIPAFITLKFFNFELHDSYAETDCETAYCIGGYKNVFVSKNLKQIAIIYKCVENPYGGYENYLEVKDVITNISEGHDIW